MPYKDPKKQKEYQARRYQETAKAKQVERNRSERSKRRAVVDKIKLERGCNRCGYDRCTAALEFHHCGEKNFGIGDGIIACRSVESILAEVELCELICANCHREEHAGYRYHNN